MYILNHQTSTIKWQLSWNDILGFQGWKNIVIGNSFYLEIGKFRQKKELYLEQVEQGEYGGKNSPYPLKTQIVLITQISCNSIS